MASLNEPPKEVQSTEAGKGAAAEDEAAVDNHGIGTIAVPDDASKVMKGGDAAKASDYANYFCSYAYLYHQKQMLTDRHRMQSYFDAIMKNRDIFEGKTVVDVGTGSGILAVWSAKAGASHVWAVEFTDMAKHAKTLVENNEVQDRVKVVKGAIEELDLPEKSVDIMISEWMGYFLLRESMLDSLIRGRDRLLKPGGAMFPSHSTMFWGMVTCEDERMRQVQELDGTMQDWNAFCHDASNSYGVNMRCLEGAYEKEQRDYYLMSSHWCELAGDQVIGQPAAIKHLDLHTCTIEDSLGVNDAPFHFTAPQPTVMSGFAGWFEVDFAGSNELACREPVVLSTAPHIGYTHWGQQVFFLQDAIELQAGESVNGTISMVRQKDSERLYNIIVKFRVRRGETLSPMTTVVYEMP